MAASMPASAKVTTRPPGSASASGVAWAQVNATGGSPVVAPKSNALVYVLIAVLLVAIGLFVYLLVTRP